MGVTWSQLFPPAPALTESNLPRQDKKVFVVTGGYSGVGRELSSILYRAGGTVYIAGRSESKAKEAIKAIKTLNDSEPLSGSLQFLQLDLSDLSSVKTSAKILRKKEPKIDVLFNNAAISLPATGSKSEQGFELQLATNCLGPWLFTKLLLPSLQTAAASAATGSVRVVWTSSMAVDMSAPKGGVELRDLDNPPRDQVKNYATSKTGNWFLASELANSGEGGGKGILSVTQNPGNLATNLLREHPYLAFLVRPLLYHAKFGAYTELWAGLSEQLTLESNGCYIIPWGRIHPAPRVDLMAALKTEEEGGTGQGSEFMKFVQNTVEDFL